MFLCSWIYASNCVLNRALKHVHHAIVMFWHGVCGITLAILAISIESLVVGGPVRFFNYDAQIYLLIVAATVFDSLAVNAVTIAFQSDSSGFVALISYINILYAFVADRVIFHESFSWIELVAALLILMVTVGTSIYKICESNKAKALLNNDSFMSADDINRSGISKRTDSFTLADDINRSTVKGQ